MAALALGALVVVSSLSVSTYALSRRYLLDQRESSAVRQARANARLVRSVLRAPEPDLPRLLSSLETPSTSRSVVNSGDRWVATTVAVGRDAITPELRDLVVRRREPAKQRYLHQGQTVLAAGFPLAEGDSYFEVFPLLELQRTLRTLRFSLLAASGIALVGSLAVGAWVSGRVLRPVAEIGRTAAAIASGQLDARLDAAGDEELVALATGFNAMVESLQDRIERDARFSSDVSHEVRSPLTTMKSAVSVMESRRARLDTRSQRALDLLSAEVHRFERLVGDLLEISKFDAGVARLDLRPTNVADVVARAVAAAGPGPPPAVDVPADLVVEADGRRLQQVVLNLVANAVVHAGGVERVTAGRSAGRLTIVVEDRGPGVAPEHLDLIFERFARAAGAGRRASGEGVGLGLALVAEHVRLHGGRVWVENRDGGGCRFVVELPCRS